MNEVTLNNGIKIPQLGYGVYQLKDYKLCYESVLKALKAGYCLIDTASAYFNEQAVGDAWVKAKDEGILKREDVILETKVWLQDFSKENVRRSVARSMEYLHTDYLDIVILHQPFGNWQEAYQALEQLYLEGRIRAIGVSNFSEKKMKELLSFAKVKPAINQIERHPFFAEDEYVEKLKDRNVQAQSWGPLCEGLKGIFDNPVLTKIGEKYHKTAAQVALRWNIQNGCCAVVKSTREKGIKEDIDIFDFSLNEDDFAQIASLDIGHSEIIDFDNPVTERLLFKLKIHD